MFQRHTENIVSIPVTVILWRFEGLLAIKMQKLINWFWFWSMECSSAGSGGISADVSRYRRAGNGAFKVSMSTGSFPEIPLYFGDIHV